MVQAFMTLGEGELGAFRAYAGIYPDDCLLLVDTIDTLNSGVPNAIKVFRELKEKGHTPVGIRLDSGDLAHLSIRAASMLNKAGFENTSIVLSNQLDELVVWQILSQIREEAPQYGLDPGHLIDRLVYGVGTRLITSAGDSALDGIYKLTAVKENGNWVPAIKISENPVKIINPGDKRLWRIYDKRNKAVADYFTIADEVPDKQEELYFQHPVESETHQVIDRTEVLEIEPLLADIIKDGERVRDLPSIDEMRKTRQSDLDRLDSGVKRLINPHVYHVSLSKKLWELKQNMIARAGGGEMQR
jgi:nicotinate phosphoribosyltransferase